MVEKEPSLEGKLARLETRIATLEKLNADLVRFGDRTNKILEEIRRTQEGIIKVAAQNTQNISLLIDFIKNSPHAVVTDSSKDDLFHSIATSNQLSEINETLNQRLR